MTLLVIVVIVTVAWRLRFVYTHPWGPHWRCGGSGKNGGSSGKSWGRCRSKRCKGGEVLRLSARLMYGLMGREAK